ncbi:hypothetical protein [Planktotalea arctica]|nr:hypothetical protein [Planktotalea arctica]
MPDVDLFSDQPLDEGPASGVKAMAFRAEPVTGCIEHTQRQITDKARF